MNNLCSTFGSMIYCLNTSRRIEAATRLNRRFSESRLMLCSPRIKGSWLYSGCSTWVPRSTALTISSSSGDWTYPSALMKMHSNGSSLTSQVGDNTYATTVGRTSEISLVECAVPQGSVLGLFYFVFFYSRCLRHRWRARLRYSWICRWHADLQPLCRRRHAPPHIQACRLHRQYRGLDDEQPTQAQRVKNRIHLVWFGSSSGQVYVRVDRDQRVLHSSIQDSPQPRRRPGSVFESGVSRRQADKYIVLSHTSAAYDPLNAHQWCLPRSRRGPHSFEAGLLQWAPCQSTGLSSGSTVRYDACCCQTHPPATSKKSLFWRHPSPAPLAWHLGACSFQTMRSRIHESAPSYLSKYCIPVSSIAGRSHLRSAASGDLFIPATNTVTIGPRAFAVACPAAWNSLPTGARTPWQKHKSDDVPEETENLFIQNQLVNSCATLVLGVNRFWTCFCDFLRKAW